MNSPSVLGHAALTGARRDGAAETANQPSCSVQARYYLPPATARAATKRVLNANIVMICVLFGYW